MCGYRLVPLTYLLKFFVRHLLDQKNFGCLSNCRYCADGAQNLPVTTRNNVLTVLQI